MGLLDEAIRQHLELKRQHGASDEELHMQEQEALGPVRREPEQPAAASTEDAEPASEPTLEEDADHAYHELPPEAGADAPVYEEAPMDQAGEAPLEPPGEAFHEPIDTDEEPVVAEADAATETTMPEQDLESEPIGDTPSRGFEALPEPALGEEGEDDVLEETPEFLQETPEHDRLWFEQRPPRDFDFDE